MASDLDVYEGTLEVLGVHVTLTHWTQAALAAWLRDPHDPPLARTPQALQVLMSESERYCWKILGSPTNHQTPLGVNVATYHLRVTRREAQL